MGDESHSMYVDSRRRALGIAQAGERAIQQHHLESVASRIGGAIIEFMRLRDGEEFFADDLRQFVEGQVGRTAPGSADRILRMLRQQNRVAYSVVDRSRSLYQAGYGIRG